MLGKATEWKLFERVCAMLCGLGYKATFSLRFLHIKSCGEHESPACHE